MDHYFVGFMLCKPVHFLNMRFGHFLCSIHTKKRTSERDVMDGQNLAEMLLMAYYLKFWVQNFEILY